MLQDQSVVARHGGEEIAVDEGAKKVDAHKHAD
jgi:hypothetical protein